MEAKIRCINRTNNKVRFFKKSICMSDSWQRSTGFVPQAAPSEEKSLWNMDAVQELISEGQQVKPRGRPRKQIENADRS